MNKENSGEKRCFSRVPFDADVLLTSGDKVWRSKLLDISLNGILTEIADEWEAGIGEHFSLEILFSDSGALITGDVSVAHIGEKRIGFRLNNIDLESVTHLKRLVELNLGDSDLLDRELSALNWR